MLLILKANISNNQENVQVSESRYLLITGGEGSGKSATLAHLVHQQLTAVI
jgi:Tfp pilus assembly pilus retraction ATPase PilT